MRIRVFDLALILAALLACNQSTPAAAELEQRAGTQIQRAPPGEVETILPRLQAQARKDGRQLLVVVSAPWCGTCKKFKADVGAGRYDTILGDFRFVEFDSSDDRERLEPAGCATKLIPMFAGFDADGHCVDSYAGYGTPVRMAARFRKLVVP
ncbi:MAG: thioredoxin family protein [Polyangiaceae bacterium]